jgi:hypothetical protein
VIECHLADVSERVIKRHAGGLPARQMTLRKLTDSLRCRKASPMCQLKTSSLNQISKHASGLCGAVASTGLNRGGARTVVTMASAIISGVEVVNCMRLPAP